MERVDANLVPFAQNNPSGYRFAFGTDTATDDINTNYNDNIKKGWGTTPNEFPEVEDFNAMAYTTGYLLSYLYQMGIAEWNDKQKYRQYSRVIGSDGIVYKAKTGTDISPNVGNNPITDTTNWEIDNQFNINGLTNKTTPVDTDNFAIQESGGLLKKISWANIKATLKAYTDALYVTLTGNQTIGGIKEFTSSPIVPAVTSGDSSTKVASTAFVTGQDLGVGQTWANVTSSRVAGTTYTNTTGKPISLSIRVQNTTNGATVAGSLTIYGVSISAFDVNDATGSQFTFSGIVPNDQTYSINISSGVLNAWFELR